MRKSHLVATILGVTLALGSPAARAGTIYNTTDPATGFGGTSLTLLSSSGADASLTFIPTSDTDSGVPSNINYGFFSLFCATCSTQSGGVGSVFSPFTFDLILTDVSDSATGRFVGTSTGGTVYANTSLITINWNPIQLGTDTNNALTGNFGSTAFQIIARTRIVAPNSGTLPGITTVEGTVGSGSDFPIEGEVPEPFTFGLVGCSLLGLGLWQRRRFAQQ